MIKFVFVSLFFLYPVFAFSPQEEAKSFYDDNQSILEDSTHNLQVESVPAYVTDHPSEADYSFEEFEDKSYELFTLDEDLGFAKDSIIEAPRFDIDSEDEIIVKSYEISEDVGNEELIDNITSSYDDCEVENTVSESKSTRRSCDEYYGTVTTSCHKNQIVEVDTDYRYECNREIFKYDKNCDQVLQVSVETIGGTLSEENFGDPIAFANIQSFWIDSNSSESDLIHFHYANGDTEKLKENFVVNDLILIENSNFSKIATITEILPSSVGSKIVLDSPLTHDEQWGCGGHQFCIPTLISFDVEIKRKISDPIEHIITKNWEEVCDE